MNRVEHLLVCLMEEPTEVIQEIMKALDEGVFEVDPKTKRTWLELIQLELADLDAILELLKEEGVNFDIDLARHKASMSSACRDLDKYDRRTVLIGLANSLAEFAQAVSKCLRFSLNHRGPQYNKNNIDRAHDALTNVCVYHTGLMMAVPISSNVKNYEFINRKNDKKHRTLKLMEVAVKVGSLESDKVQTHAGTV